jgi:hypothetical protein
VTHLPPIAGGVLVLGLVVVIAAQFVMPLREPLFDGVVVNDPYRWLSPPPGQDGSPTSADETIAVKGGVSPAFAVYTHETPPQAEVLAHGGELPTGVAVTSLRVRIDPTSVTGDEARGGIAGNVYRVRVTDSSGFALSPITGQTVTLAMRSPPGLGAGGAIARFDGGGWESLDTQPSGLADLLLANVDAFGDFAVIGTLAPPTTNQSPVLLIVAIVGGGLILLLGAWSEGSRPNRRTGTGAGRRARR